MMSNKDSQSLSRNFLALALLSALFHLLQAVCGLTLWVSVGSQVLLIFGLAALVGALRETVLAIGIVRHDFTSGYSVGNSVRRVLCVVGAGYFLVGIGGIAFGVQGFVKAERHVATLLGVGLAAISLLVIPIIGSFMKTLAIELRSSALSTASVFTFGNSYLSMVLLISLLINAGTDLWWGDALGAIVMAPYLIQQGIQIFLNSSLSEFVED